jgi:hypothetical protein
LAKACFWAGVSSFVDFSFHCRHVFCLAHILNFIDAVVHLLCTYAIGQADASCLAYQISEQASIIFEETMRQDRHPINMIFASEPMLLSAYIEDCRMKLWDHAFSTYFRGSDSFKKSDDFVGFSESDQVVRRVLFRYVSVL